MTRIALGKELQILKNLITDMAKNVDEMVHGAILAINKLDPEIAKRIIDADDQIDYYDHMVVQTALEIIALQQPVAKDLRFVITAIDISRNLERTADQAVNIAYSVFNLSKNSQLATLIPKCKIAIEEMAQEALNMLHSAINAFVTENSQQAKSVIDYDTIVDRLQKDLIEEVKNCMKRNNELIDCGIDYIVVIENIERIADLATNIAEGVIFVTEGRMVKLEEQQKVTLSDLKKAMFKDLPIFELLEKHAQLVIECIERLSLSLEAYYNKDFKKLSEIATHIFEIEKEADKIKRNIREHLPKGVILPVERFELFMYLKEQDAIADVAEEILNWLSFKHISINLELHSQIEELLSKSIETLKNFKDMIKLSGIFLIYKDEESRSKAIELIREIRYAQYLTEEFSNKVKKNLFEKLTNALDLFYYLKLVDLIIQISHHAENTADLMRIMLSK